MSSKPPIQPLILLIVADKKRIVSTRNQLAQEGVLRNHLAVCASIKEATSFLSTRQEFTTVLVDLSLSSTAVLKELTEFVEQFLEKAILVLADKADKHLGLALIKAGIQDFLLKEDIEERNLYESICFAVERKRAGKQQLAEKISKVRQKNQQLYQNIFNNSKDAIYICNLEGYLVDFNQSTFELLAYSEEELSEIEVHDLFLPKDQKNTFLYQLVTTKSVNDFPIAIEQKNGNKRQCLISASMIQTAEFTGYSGVLRDVTEQQKAEGLRKARDIAQQSAKMKEQFIANISHEMRTPMNAILGMSNLAIQTELSPEQYNYISSIKQSSEILLGVVNDILVISEIQNSQLKFEYQFFNLYELLHNLMNVLQYQAKEKDLLLSLHINDAIPKILHGDKARLNQILYNLVLNAIKFTQEGSIQVLIENLNQSIEFVQLKFTVTDTGIGIPSDKIEAVFETFTRIREQGMTQKGRGLGLPIAKNLVEQQGGKMGVFSEVGKGSSFYFDLLFEIGEEVFPEPSKAKAVANLDQGGLRVLLVEDHKMNQLVAIKTLEKHWADIKIRLANDGQEAIDILKQESVDIILMDIQMPNMNGYEASVYIRQKLTPEKAAIPIIAMTAHTQVAKNEKFREYGMDDCIIKPFEPKELFRKIMEYTFKYKITV